MTHYSDLLDLVADAEALEHGTAARRSDAELRALCTAVLASDPEDQLAVQVLAILDSRRSMMLRCLGNKSPSLALALEAMLFNIASRSSAASGASEGSRL
jgi:hypothetical protein